MGVILLVMVNLLLLVVNILDIRFTWFGFDPKEVDNLAYYVHHGTYVLIFSISLSMFILLYLFRGSQNFYNNNRFMKYLAFVWIFQNVIMAVSVFIRNFYYIQYYFALSYKRIGVIIFLILVFIGLITMFVKIYNKKTTFYLFKVNSLAAFIMLILMSSYSWDPQIAEFNLSNPDKDRIDIHYLMCLSDDTLPILDMNRDVLDKNYFYYRNKFNGLEELERRKAEFFAEQGRCTWLSWNLSDNSVKKYFSNIKTGGSS
jgi:hypothetical protein